MCITSLQSIIYVRSLLTSASVKGYELTVVPDENQTPLAGVIPGIARQELFITLACGFLIFACACLAVIYIHSCRKYQRRINELAMQYENKSEANKSWNIFSLKKVLNDLECDVTEQMVQHVN